MAYRHTADIGNSVLWTNWQDADFDPRFACTWADGFLSSRCLQREEDRENECCGSKLNNESRLVSFSSLVGSEEGEQRRDGQPQQTLDEEKHESPEP